MKDKDPERVDAEHQHVDPHVVLEAVNEVRLGQVVLSDDVGRVHLLEDLVHLVLVAALRARTVATGSSRTNS